MAVPPVPLAWTPAPPAPAPPYRSSPEWAVVAIGAACFVTVLEVAQAVLVIPAAAEYRNAAQEGMDGADVFTPFDAVTAFSILAFTFAYVATCVWLQRVRRNACALRP